MSHQRDTEMIYSAAILLIFIIIFMLIVNYSNNYDDNKNLKILFNFSEKKLHGHDYINYVNNLTAAYEIFLNYTNVMNQNAIPMFEAMHKHYHYDKYIKAMNKANTLLNKLYVNTLALQDAVNKTNINETLVKNLVYDTKHDLKELYKEINKAQYELFYPYEQVLKHDYLYQQFSGNINNILKVQVSSHLLIANGENSCLIQKKYHKILEKLGFYCDKKIIYYIEELYSIFCQNFYHWYDKNID